MTPNPVLVLAAHPDDEVLGCGGVMARLAAAGAQVAVAILGEGATSRGDGPEAAQRLRQCAQEAAGLLGAGPVRFLGLPDNRFDSLDLLDIVKPVEALLREFRPALVLTHHPGDLNIDHALTFRAALTAARPQPGSSVRCLRTFEIASSTEWSFDRLGQPFRPDAYYDISATLDLKCRALACYADELRPFPHPRSEAALRAAALLRGSRVGLAAAEAFETIYDLR